MTVAGNFSKLTFVNGTTPAINAVNLNDIENYVNLLDDEAKRSSNFDFKFYKQYMYDNSTKLITDFSDINDWSEYSSAGTVTWFNNTNMPLLHNTTIRCYDDDDVAGEAAIYDTTFPQINLDKFTSGITAGSSELIVLICWIDDETQTTRITMRFGTDSSNYYYYNKTSGLQYGWNVIAVPKSSFSTTGSISDWTAIDYVSFRVYFETNSSGYGVNFNHCALIRADQTTPTLMNPFVLNDYTGSTDNWDIPVLTPNTQFMLYRDRRTGQICIKDVSLTTATTADPNFIGTGFICNSFIAKMDCLINDTSYMQSIMWYVDDDNYIMFEINAEDIQITERYGASTTQYYQDINGTMDINDQFTIYCEKNEDQLRVWLVSTGDNSCMEFSFDASNFSNTDEGEVGIGTRTDQETPAIYDFVVSAKQDTLVVSDYRKIIYKIKKNDESTSSDTTVSTDSELSNIKIPIGTYRVTGRIFYESNSNTSDFKRNWDINGTYELLSYTHTQGLPTATTSVSNTNVDHEPTLINGSDAYGGVNTYVVTLAEEFLIRAIDTLIVNFQWAQNTSEANNTTVKAGSYILFEKLDY